MSAVRRWLREGTADEAGFTLPELIMAITLLAIVMAPLALALMTSLRVIGRADQRFGDSRSSLISAAYFANDVESAQTVQVVDPSPCGGAAGVTPVVSFLWADAASGKGATPTKEVSYVIDASDVTNKKLLRRYCTIGGPATTSTTAVSLGATAPAVTCFKVGNVVDASCGPSTRRVQMVLTAKPNSPTPDDPNPVPYSFTLEGTRRAK
jgi:prepilin-type N-terminal cleavage/methylation domain-containing protein